MTVGKPLLPGLKGVSLGVLAAFAVLALSQVHSTWWFQDSAAYWGAALRLRDVAS